MCLLQSLLSKRVDKNVLKPRKFKYRLWASACAVVQSNTGLLLNISGSYREDVRCFTAVLWEPAAQGKEQHQKNPRFFPNFKAPIVAASPLPFEARGEASSPPRHLQTAILSGITVTFFPESFLLQLAKCKASARPGEKHSKNWPEGWVPPCQCCPWLGMPWRPRCPALAAVWHREPRGTEEQGREDAPGIRPGPDVSGHVRVWQGGAFLEGFNGNRWIKSSRNIAVAVCVWIFIFFCACFSLKK